MKKQCVIGVLHHSLSKEVISVKNLGKAIPKVKRGIFIHLLKSLKKILWWLTGLWLENSFWKKSPKYSKLLARLHHSYLQFLHFLDLNFNFIGKLKA